MPAGNQSRTITHSVEQESVPMYIVVSTSITNVATKKIYAEHTKQKIQGGW
jgi:hypothetical protein